MSEIQHTGAEEDVTHAPHVEGEGAQIAAAEARGRARDQRRPAHVLRARRQLTGRGEGLLTAKLGEFLVDVAQPGEHAADPLDTSTL